MHEYAGPGPLSPAARVRLTAKNPSARMVPRTRAAEIPILIVGAGPVSLALAADLGKRRVPCLVIEQGEGPPDHPRASALNARSMKFMRRFGVADAVRAASAPEDFPHTALYCTSLNGFEIARIERPHHGGKAFGARQVPLATMSIADPTIGALYERRLVLVRPDGHVAWRSDALPKDARSLVDRVRGSA
jgi:hypothetical protein